MQRCIRLETLKSDTRCRDLKFSRRHPSGELAGMDKDAVAMGEGRSLSPGHPRAEVRLERISTGCPSRSSCTGHGPEAKAIAVVDTVHLVLGSEREERTGEAETKTERHERQKQTNGDQRDRETDPRGKGLQEGLAIVLKTLAWSSSASKGTGGMPEEQ